MKINKISLIVLSLLSLASFSACKVSRFVVYNFPDIKDHKKFPYHSIAKGENTFQFATAHKEKVPKAMHIKGKDLPFEQYLKDNKTVAFLVIQNDSILYEKYWSNYDSSSIVPSFSVAKSVASLLIGCAIDEKLIQSVDEPITNYIPELKKNGFDKVTIEHVLQMTSGLDFNESYINPFGEAASFYYGRNLRKQISKLKLNADPGTQFEYVSGNTQLLGLILERALKNKSVSAYLQEKIWQPLGMEFDATWSLDQKKNGIEKTFCCLNARARDYAKIGRLMLNNGNWNGKQIVSESWIKQSTKIDTTAGSAWFYQYQWWMPSQNGDYMAEGILGQFIYVHPEKNLVIVRLGKSEGKANWSEILSSLGQAY